MPTAAMLTTLLLVTMADDAPYERTRPKDAEPNPEQLKVAIEREMRLHGQLPAKPPEKPDARSGKRAQYLAEKAAKKAQAKQKASPKPSLPFGGSMIPGPSTPIKDPDTPPYQFWDCKEYGDVAWFSSARVIQILSPTSVLVETDEGRSHKTMIVEGIETTELKGGDNDFVGGKHVFALINQVTYTSVDGARKTLPLFKAIPLPEAPKPEKPK